MSTGRSGMADTITTDCAQCGKKFESISGRNFWAVKARKNMAALTERLAEESGGEE